MGNLLITGSQGQIGTELRNILGDQPNIFYADREELDITDEKAVKAYIDQHSIDTVINCAAYTAVDGAEDEPELANAVNNIGAGILAKYAKTIIHISTDYVFDGTGHLPYKPEDTTNPVSVYGKTKLAGEQSVLANAQTAIIIRTAWVYSPYGSNFVKTMLRLGKERDTLNVVADQIGSPTCARDLADAIVQILPQIKLGTKQIVHYTNEGICSWYDFAVAIMEETGVTCKVNPIETSEYSTKAKRPAYSVLETDKIQELYGVAIRHWRNALNNYFTYNQKMPVNEKE